MKLILKNLETNLEEKKSRRAICISNHSNHHKNACLVRIDRCGRTFK